VAFGEGIHNLSFELYCESLRIIPNIKESHERDSFIFEGLFPKMG
jgi:hypothetical protein